MYSAFAAMRFVSGMSHAGMFIMSFGLSMEYTGLKWRVFCGCLIETPFAIGGLVVGFLAWAGVRDWRTLQLLCSTPFILLLGYQWLIPESPRWLLAKSKFNALEADVEKTASVNGKPYPATVMKRLRALSTELEAGDGQEDSGEATTTTTSAGKATVLDLFRPLPIGLRTLNMFYNWFVATMCYYGLTAMAAELSGDIFLDYTLLIAIEIPAHFFCIYMLDRWGRKPILSFSLILSGVSCIIAGLVSSISWLQARNKLYVHLVRNSIHRFSSIVDACSDRQVRRDRLLHDRVRLHRRAVPHRDQEHGSGI